MSERFNHRRGYSQQISKSIKIKDKDLLDLRHNYAFSSEHTRSTAFTLHKNRDKDKIKIQYKNKEKRESQKDKKTKYQFNKLENAVWKQQEAPFTPNQILKLYNKFLTADERRQIKEYQNIYYIGNKFKQQCPTKQIKQISVNMQQGFLSYNIGDHIAYRYQIIQRINKGSFGQVIKVYDHKSRQFQALKIVKRMPDLVKQTFVQISILTNIKQKDKGDVSGIVRIKDFTIFRQHICISFELLDANLYQLLHANQFKGFNSSFVRIFAIQILNSLNFLKKMNIVHCDIKPENFVLKVWGKSGIKLIDFGTSCYENQQVYSYIQSRYYRAPQIIFQRHYSASIDMWSFGCMIAQLSLGKPLFPGNSDIHQLLYFINLMGYPQLQFSRKCKMQIERIRENKYLQRDSMGKLIKQNLDKIQNDTGCNINIQALKTLEQRWSGEMFPFIHFLKQILKWDPHDRMTPAQALQHPWITSGLPNQIKQLYNIYQNIDNNIQIISENKKTKKIKTRSKSKSKSRQKNRQKSSPMAKISKQIYMSSNFCKNYPKNIKFDLPQTLLSIKSKTAKNSQQKSRSQKNNKSPYSIKNRRI